MKGYLLVQCDRNDYILTCIKETPGVYSVLPFTEKVTIEDIERHGLPDLPSSLSVEEVQKHTVDPKTKPIVLKYKVGDEVVIVAGPFSGQETKVVSIVGESRVMCPVSVFGRETNSTFDVSQIRKK